MRLATMQYFQDSYVGIFPNGTAKSKIIDTFKKAIKRDKKSKGWDNDDMEEVLSNVKEYIEISNFVSGRIYGDGNFSCSFPHH